MSAWRRPLGHCITLGHTHRPPLWYNGVGLMETRPFSFWYVAVFQQNFAFSGKPLIFSTQWGLFCGSWHCWISVTSQNKVTILASRLGFIKNLRLTCKITHNYLRCIILSTSFTFSVEKSWQLQKTSGADVLLPRKKIRKTLRPPPPSTWKSPLQWKEWFCMVDLSLEKMKLMMQTHL